MKKYLTAVLVLLGVVAANAAPIATAAASKACCPLCK